MWYPTSCHKCQDHQGKRLRVNSTIISISLVSPCAVTKNQKDGRTRWDRILIQPLWLCSQYFYRPQTKFHKSVFSQGCVKNSGHGGGGGMCDKGGVCMAGGMCGRVGACAVGGGMHGRGHAWQGEGHARQERWPLQRTVRILLECILVISLDAWWELCQGNVNPNYVAFSASKRVWIKFRHVWKKRQWRIRSLRDFRSDITTKRFTALRWI